MEKGSNVGVKIGVVLPTKMKRRNQETQKGKFEKIRSERTGQATKKRTSLD